MKYLLVGFGGMLGALFRFLISKWLDEKILANFSLGTLIVNTSGAFLLSFFIGLNIHHNIIREDLFLAASVGFIGAFTTFSSFSYENIQLTQAGELKDCLNYTFLTLTLGLLGAGLGLTAGHYFIRGGFIFGIW